MNASLPPHFAEWLLKALLPSRDRDVIAGDLLEEYQEVVVPSLGLFRARMWYWRQTMSIIQTSRGQSFVWLAAGLGACAVILTGLLRANFGPFLPLLLFGGIAGLTGAIALSAVHSRVAASTVWVIGRWCALALLVVLAGKAEIDHIYPLSGGDLGMSRGIVFGASLAAVFFAAGLVGASRGLAVRLGIVTALFASVVGSVTFLLAVKGSTYLVPLVSGQAEPFVPGPWEVFASPEAWKAILVLTGVSVVVGATGAMIGRGWSGLTFKHPL